MATFLKAYPLRTKLDLDLRSCLEVAASQYPDNTLAGDTVEQVLAYIQGSLVHCVHRALGHTRASVCLPCL